MQKRMNCAPRSSSRASPRERGLIDYDRVRAEVPECEGLSDREINALLARIDFWGSMSTDQRNLISDRSSTLTAFDPGSQSYPLTARGREVLAAIEACRVTEAEAEPDPDEPEPIGYSLRALLGLAWICPRRTRDPHSRRCTRRGPAGRDIWRTQTHRPVARPGLIPAPSRAAGDGSKPGRASRR